MLCHIRLFWAVVSCAAQHISSTPKVSNGHTSPLVYKQCHAMWGMGKRPSQWLGHTVQLVFIWWTWDFWGSSGRLKCHVDHSIPHEKKNDVTMPFYLIFQRIFLFLSWSCRHDILDILTLVNYEVGRGDAKMEDGMFKQSPAPMYSLRKKLLFTQLSNWWQHMELVWSLQCWTLWNNLNDDFMHVEGCVCVYIYREYLSL